MKKIRTAIIGQGRSGRNIHATNLISKELNDKFQVVAVCDPRIERCGESVTECGCEAYQDYRQMLQRNDIDLVVNASMSHQHVPINIEIMEAGHNLLSEKPLAATCAEVDRMSETAGRNNVLFAVFQQSRFSPTFLKVKEVMDSGVLGRIIMVKVYFNSFARRWDWQTLQCMNAGNLFNTGPHPLDQALQLFGGNDDPEVFSIMDSVNFAGDAEGFVKVILKGKDHPVIDLEVSSCAAHTPLVYQVFAANGGLSGDHSKLEWKYFDPIAQPIPQLIMEPMPERKYCGETLEWKNDSWVSSEKELDFNYRVVKFYESLYSTIRDGAPLAVSVEQVRRQIKVIEECHRQNPLPRKFSATTGIQS